MGKLYDQIKVEMLLRNDSPKTIDAYIGHMKAYTRLLGSHNWFPINDI